MVMKKLELSDWLNSINYTKQNLIKDSPDLIKSYPAYVINKCLAMHIDTVLYANQMNECYELDHDMQYSFYLNSIRKKKRFSSSIKKSNLDDLEYVKQYYNYSTAKAIQVLNILSKEQLNFIKQKLDKGGLK
jgi:hypothetical protein